MKSSLSFLRGPQVYLALIFAALLLFLCLYNLEFYPRLWFDEGWHLQAAKHLAQTREYCFGPGVGPTVFYPVAWAFRLFGVGLLQARLVMASYLLLTVAMFYLLAKQLYGGTTAMIASFILITSSGIGLVVWGRQVLGEIPAIAFFLMGTLCWFRTVDTDSNRLPFLFLAGIFFGLSILTKNQYLILVLALIGVWIADLLYYRRLRPMQLTIPLLCTAFCLLAWYGALNLLADPRVVKHTVEQWQTALPRSILLLSPRLVLNSARFVFGPRVFCAWALPGLLYGGFIALKRDCLGLKTAFLLLFASLWLTWYIVASVGWERYASPPLIIVSLFVARLLFDLIRGDRISLRRLWAELQEGTGLATARRLCFLIVLLVINLHPLANQVHTILFQVDRVHQEFADYLNAHVSKDIVIETWEPELGFLTEHKYHYPPARMVDTMSRHLALGTPSPAGTYDFQAADPAYLVIGAFGKWTGLYPADFLRHHCTLVISIGLYDLYQVN